MVTACMYVCGGGVTCFCIIAKSMYLNLCPNYMSNLLLVWQKTDEQEGRRGDRQRLQLIILCVCVVCAHVCAGVQPLTFKELAVQSSFPCSGSSPPFLPTVWTTLHMRVTEASQAGIHSLPSPVKGQAHFILVLFSIQKCFLGKIIDYLQRLTHSTDYCHIL